MIVGAPVSALYGGLCALLLLLLAGLVVNQRHALKVGLGDGGHEALARAMRVQANFVEYVPLALVLMLLLEINGIPAKWLHMAGVVLIGSRLLHAWGFSHSSGTSFGRMVGTIGTFGVLFVLAVLALKLAVRL